MNFQYSEPDLFVAPNRIAYTNEANIVNKDFPVGAQRPNFVLCQVLCKVNPKNNQRKHTTKSLARSRNHYPLITMSQFTL